MGQVITSQTIAIACADGTVAIMCFVLDDQRGITRDGTDAEIDAEIAKASLESPSVSWRRIVEADIPSQRDFRNAWTDHGTHIGFDMPKARAMHMERLRNGRNIMLATTDGEMQRATEQGKAQDVAALKASRQALRDLPATYAAAIASAATADELRAIDPLGIAKDYA